MGTIVNDDGDQISLLRYGHRMTEAFAISSPEASNGSTTQVGESQAAEKQLGRLVSLARSSSADEAMYTCSQSYQPRRTLKGSRDSQRYIQGQTRALSEPGLQGRTIKNMVMTEVSSHSQKTLPAFRT